MTGAVRLGRRHGRGREASVDAAGCGSNETEYETETENTTSLPTLHRFTKVHLALFDKSLGPSSVLSLWSTWRMRDNVLVCLSCVYN